MEYSKNKRAEKVVSKREAKWNIIDFPCELGYHCPVCEYKSIDELWNYDDRLDRSEYNYFLWCRKCNKDYPSVICQPNIDKATDIFLNIIQDIKWSQNN